MCINLIQSMFDPNHKLYILLILPNKVEDVRDRTIRSNGDRFSTCNMYAVIYRDYVTAYAYHFYLYLPQRDHVDCLSEH
jgi:hypothetical protein